MAEESISSQVAAKLLDNLSVLLVVLGVIVVMLGITGGVTYGGWLPIPDGVSRVVAGLFGGVLVFLGLFGPKVSSLPDPKQYGVKILTPKPGDSVDVVDVRGTIKDKALPEGYELYVFRLYPQDHFYPIRRCHVVNGEWEATRCDLGAAVHNDWRAFSVNLVGPSGLALIRYIESAAQVHNAVRDELQCLTPNTKVPYMPLCELRTRDMLECARVDVKRA